MRISDWSSDVCSSDLEGDEERQVPRLAEVVGEVGADEHEAALGEVDDAGRLVDDHEAEGDEGVLRAERDALEDELEELGHRRSEARSVGQECSVRVDHGGRCISKKKNENNTTK